MKPDMATPAPAASTDENAPDDISPWRRVGNPLPREGRPAPSF